MLNLEQLNILKKTTQLSREKEETLPKENLKLISKHLMSLEINLRFFLVCSIVLNLA